MVDLSRIKGVVVPIITPLTPDEKVDEPALRRCLRHVLASSVHGIFVNSTTGEGLSLLDEEKEKAIGIVVDEAKDRAVIFAGISDTSTMRVLRNLRRVEALNADVAVLHPPFYYPLNHQSELVEFYTHVAAASILPLMLYNIPSMTKAPIAIDTVSKLMAIDNIVGIKDSSVDFLYLLELIRLKAQREDFKIFIGKSHLWTAGIFSGADGALDGISNLVPGLCVQLYETMLRGEAQKAFALQRKINDIWEIYSCGSFLSGIKTALSLLGLCDRRVTRPILNISDDEVENIKKIMVKHGLL